MPQRMPTLEWERGVQQGKPIETGTETNTSTFLKAALYTIAGAGAIASGYRGETVQDGFEDGQELFEAVTDQQPEQGYKRGKNGRAKENPQYAIPINKIVELRKAYAEDNDAVFLPGHEAGNQPAEASSPYIALANPTDIGDDINRSELKNGELGEVPYDIGDLVNEFLNENNFKRVENNQNEADIIHYTGDKTNLNQVVNKFNRVTDDTFSVIDAYRESDGTYVIKAGQD